MKKVSMILVVLLIGLRVSAQDWFGMEYGIDLGYSSSQFGGYNSIPNIYIDALSGKNKSDITYTKFMNKEKNFYQTLFTKGWLFNTFFIGGAITVQDAPRNHWYQFSTNFLNYKFETGLKWRWVEIAYIHECSHPTMPYSYKYRTVSLWGEGSTDRLVLSVKGSVGTVPKYR